MALDNSRLSTAIKDALLAGGIANDDVDPDNPGEDPPLTQLCDAIASAIVTEITGNLEIKVPGSTYVDTVTGGSGAPAVGIKKVGTTTCSVA